MENPQKTTPHKEQPPGLWNSRSRMWIVGLLVLLLAGNFFFQIQAFLLGGGIIIPVLVGQILGVFLPLVIIFQRNGWNLIRDLALPPVPWLLLGATILLAAASQVPTGFLAEISMRLFPGDPERVAMFQEALPRSVLGMLVAGLAVVLVGPLGEEIIFRGLLHRLASGYWGAWKAGLLSSLVFALVHAEPWLLLGLAGVGAALAFLYEATRSLLVCFVFHATHNAIALTMMYLAEDVQTTPEPFVTMDFVYLGLSLVVWILVGQWLLGNRKTREAR